MIKKIRNSQHQIELLKTKLNLHEDPLFNMLDPMEICDVVNEDEYLEPLDSRRALIQVQPIEDVEEDKSTDV